MSPQVKQCSKCEEYKPLSEYHKDRSKKSGLQYRCKTCTSATNKAYHQANPEKTRANNRRWMEKNRDLYNARRREDRARTVKAPERQPAQ